MELVNTKGIISFNILDRRTPILHRYTRNSKPNYKTRKRTYILSNDESQLSNIILSYYRGQGNYEKFDNITVHIWSDRVGHGDRRTQRCATSISKTFNF